MNEIRKPAVASMFYPDDTINLKRMINNYLSNIPNETTEFFLKNRVDQLLGIIAPHAGYVYSGQVAANAYEILKDRAIDTFILIGPSHYTHFDGYSLGGFTAFRTPLGDVKVDTELSQKIVGESGGVFDYINSAHSKEHSIEVQIPFLQTVCDNPFQIVPILMGDQSQKNVERGADILYSVLKDIDKRYLFVISTDLSHYHNHKTADKLDKRFIQLIEKMDSKTLLEECRTGLVEACGAGPTALLLELAKKANRKNIRILDYKNSGDVSGDYSRVVGYVSAAVW